MAFKITDACILCGSCEYECPNQAISEGKDAYIIDPNKCTECVGAFDKQQCVEVCPEGAPVPDPDHKETKDQLLAKYYKLHPDKKPK